MSAAKDGPVRTATTASGAACAISADGPVRCCRSIPLAVLTSAFLVWLGVFLRRERPGAEVRRWSAVLWGVLAVQMVAGFSNVILKAPGWMQLVHLLLALALWLALVMLVYRALTGLSVQGGRARVEGNV